MSRKTQLLAEKYKRSFHAFFVDAFTEVLDPAVKYKDNWHIKYICDRMQKEAHRIIRGDPCEENLIINVPVRASKSLVVSVAFNAWVWTIKPTFKVITASYSNGLSLDLSRKTRDLIKSVWYQSIFPEIQIKHDQDTKGYFENTSGGFRFATSTNGTVTGKGGDCLTGSSMIETNSGSMMLLDLVNTLNSCEYTPLVLSFNFNSGKMEYKKIVNSKKTTTGEIYEIHTNSGNIIRGTKDHRVFIEGQGFTEIRNIKKGDRLREVGRSGYNVRANMQLLRKGIRNTLIRIKEKDKKGISGFILRKEMFAGSPFYKEYKEGLQVGFMQRACEERSRLVLLRNMQRVIEGKEVRCFRYSKGMRALQERLCYSQSKNNVLFEVLPRQSTLKENDRIEKGGFKEHGGRIQDLFRIESNSYEKRFESMPSLQEQEETSLPSHRGRTRPLDRKSNDSMRKLPYEAPQGGFERVDRVVIDRSKSVDVFDIQVEGNHNFYANNILVHNCIICDDLLNPEEAESPQRRQSANDWYDETLYSRVNDLEVGSRVIIMQRLHQNDITGHLLEKGGYEHICIPARHDKEVKPIELKSNYTDGLFFPTRFTDKVLKDYENGMGERAFSAQFGQSPKVASGNIINTSKIKYLDQEPKPLKVIQTCDTAFKTGEKNDYSVMMTWYKFRHPDNPDIDSYYLAHVLHAKYKFPELKERFGQLAKRYKPYKIIIEDCASGQSLIQEFELDKYLKPLLMPVKPDKDKVTRAYSITKVVEDGLVYMPKNAQWLYDLIDELGLFDSGEHDDQVDAFVYALQYFTKKIGSHKVPRLRVL